MTRFLFTILLLVSILFLSGCCGSGSKFSPDDPVVKLGKAEHRACRFDGQRILVCDLMKQLGRRWDAKPFETLYVYDGDMRGSVDREELIESLKTYCKSRDIKIYYQGAMSQRGFELQEDSPLYQEKKKGLP